MGLSHDSARRLYSKLACCRSVAAGVVAVSSGSAMLGEEGVAWRREVVPSDGWALTARESLAVRDGVVQLVYCDRDADGRVCNGLSRAILDGGTWSYESIDEGCKGLGELATIALGADGSTHIAYQGCDRQLMYAVR